LPAPVTKAAGGMLAGIMRGVIAAKHARAYAPRDRRNFSC
jgi:hypothetical protein